MSGVADIIRGTIGENSEPTTVNMWLDTGFPPLNMALSGDYKGGMPAGRIVEMFGPESSGKTAIATKVMAKAQEFGGIAMFMDHERTFSPRLAEKLGLNLDPNHWVYQTPDTFEESVTLVMQACRAIREKEAIDKNAPIVVVFDSLASMIPQSKFSKEIDQQGMNDSLALAKASSSVFPTMAGFAYKFNILFLVLNQEREKPGVVYGDPTTTPGGKAPKFYASIRIQLGRKRIIEKSGEKQFAGQEITCKIIKNKCAKPFQEVTWNFMFDENGDGYFDFVGSMVDYLTAKGLLAASGPRIQWTDGTKYFKKALIKKIVDEGIECELTALLPK